MPGALRAAHAATLAVTCIGGGYALGTFLGKLFGLVADRDRQYYGDIGGIIGGLWGMLVFAIGVGAMLDL